MSKGRPKTPAIVKQLEGKPTTSPNELYLTPMDELPHPPEALNFCDDEKFNEWARKIWQTVVSELHGKRLLSKVHLNDIAVYCVEQARYWRAVEKIKVEGDVLELKTGYFQPNPYFAIGNKALNNVRVIATKYGLSPIDATKLAAPNSDDKNDLMKLLDA